tara:strand:+ start:10810 stop:11523 length:714 start_codon:yes stop_codon:yes gene_type:complete
MKLSVLGTLYFIIKLLIIGSSVSILVKIYKSEIIKDSKSEIKDDIKEETVSADISKIEDVIANADADILKIDNAVDNLDILKIENEVASPDTSKSENTIYLNYLLNFYDIILQSNITAIITIILFFGGMALTYFTKIKIRIKFIIKLIMIGLLISFIIIASTIDDNLNKENYDSEEKKFKTIRTQINELRNEYDTDSGKQKLFRKFQDLLLILDNLRINGYTSFSLMIFLLVTEIYK